MYQILNIDLGVVAYFKIIYYNWSKINSKTLNSYPMVIWLAMCYCNVLLWSGQGSMWFILVTIGLIFSVILVFFVKTPQFARKIHLVMLMGHAWIQICVLFIFDWDSDIDSNNNDNNEFTSTGLWLYLFLTTLSIICCWICGQFSHKYGNLTASTRNIKRKSSKNDESKAAELIAGGNNHNHDHDQDIESGAGNVNAIQMQAGRDSLKPNNGHLPQLVHDQSSVANEDSDAELKQNVNNDDSNHELVLETEVEVDDDKQVEQVKKEAASLRISFKTDPERMAYFSVYGAILVATMCFEVVSVLDTYPRMNIVQQIWYRGIIHWFYYTVCDALVWHLLDVGSIVLIYLSNAFIVAMLIYDAIQIDYAVNWEETMMLVFQILINNLCLCLFYAFEHRSNIKKRFKLDQWQACVNNLTLYQFSFKFYVICNSGIVIFAYFVFPTDSYASALLYFVNLVTYLVLLFSVTDVHEFIWVLDLLFLQTVCTQRNVAYGMVLVILVLFLYFSWQCKVTDTNPKRYDPFADVHVVSMYLGCVGFMLFYLRDFIGDDKNVTTDWDAIYILVLLVSILVASGIMSLLSKDSTSYLENVDESSFNNFIKAVTLASHTTDTLDKLKVDKLWIVDVWVLICYSGAIILFQYTLIDCDIAVFINGINLFSFLIVGLVILLAIYLFWYKLVFRSIDMLVAVVIGLGGIQVCYN